MEARVRACLIGCGRAGMIHARNYRNKIPEAAITAVVDTLPEAAQAAAKELQIHRWHTDYRQILGDKAINAVIVVAPTDLHRDIVVDCANAGKHIFCEKPMAMTVEECDEMIAACRANGVKLQIGFMRRFDASFREAKRLVESGAIGDLVLIRSNTRGPSKPRPWMYDIGKSNGILAEVNSHDIDSVRWMAGSEIRSLYALAGNFRNPEAREAYPDYYDSVLVSGTMENGVHFSVDGAAYVQYGYDSKMELVGTKGKLEVGRSERDFVRLTTPEGGTSTPFISSWMTLFTEAYLAEDTAFVEAILQDAEPPVTGLDGRMAVAAVEAGNRSIREGVICTLR
ncbi:MAG: Gfo/Idh/MocA family oxidoreductase [Clostridiales bacterium]|nr:Gfo/Idh/MocA family oxidoreductase [Bacillota bacterium]NLL55356.1 Gfo/Idh/MocA family oxidoreductase [Clostridiales bacterium]